MARGINKVILIGNLGADPEIRQTQGGNSVAQLSIATSETWKDKQTGQPQEKTEWHRAVAFNRLAEIMGEYLRKGSKVYVEGRLQTRKWQDQSGQDRYTTEIVVNDMQMLDGRSGSAPMDDSDYSSQPSSNSASSNRQSSPPGPPDDMGDDIPF